MATHKVPQDVEAEDKLVGFLSLKQFIFTILGLGFGYLTFFFFTKVHPLSAIIWLPFTLSFLVLGLYQRKDQPVEVYLASAMRFYLKPRQRKWDQEGFEERVIITAPPKIEHNYTKSFTGEEATSRLNNLSRLMDSRGWTTKLASDWQNPQLATAAASDRLVQPGDLKTAGVDLSRYMQPVDVMDEQSSSVAQDFQARISQTDTSTRQHALQTLQQARQATDDTIPSEDVPEVPQYQQYPSMHQKVVSPADTTLPVAAPVAQPNNPSPAPPALVDDQPADIPPSTPKEELADDGSVEIKLH
jgi:PrgI family protein